MTREEAQKLLAAYAAGSLSPSEQKALFKAALEDQQLFEELADEQALKEVLDQPGARERLIAALEPRSSRSAWWIRSWPWAAAAAALAIAIGVTMVVRTKPTEPQQVAQVMKAPETPVPQTAPVAPAPPAPPPRKLEKPAPPPSPAAESAPAPAENSPEDRGRVAAFAAKAPAAFQLTYTVQSDGFLQITPGAPGFLSMSANDSVIFPSAAVRPGAPVRVAIPAEATTLIVNFSANPGASGTPIQLDAASGTVADQDPPNQRISIQIPAKP